MLRKVRTGACSFAGATGVKTFPDDSLPTGASPCTYPFTAIRSTARGNPAQFTVRFGVGGRGFGGVTIESVTSETGELKIAA